MRRKAGTAAGMQGTMAAAAVVVATATLLAGCSVNWGGGMTEVLLGGKRPGEVAPAAPPADAAAPGSSTNADAAKESEELRRLEKKSKNLRSIAILPFAYAAADSALACDVCPGDMVLRPTSREAARLVTGFVYEAVARHPRFLYPTPEVVDRAMAGVPGHGLRETAMALAAEGRADYAVAGALVELRPRVGDDHEPEQAAGAVLYLALLDAHTGKVLWSDTSDRSEPGRGFFKHLYDRLINDRPVRWHTAEEWSETVSDGLVKKLVREVD